MDVFGHRRIFGGQAERVPSHRVEHAEPLRSSVAGDQVSDRVVAHVPDMELAGRVGIHFQDIVFWPAGRGIDLEEPPLAPAALPFRFALSEIVA